MQMTLCDLCPKHQFSCAEFHVEFTRTKDESCADWAMDLCRKHYEILWECIEKEKHAIQR
jgi:hypothetical protein